MDVGLKVHAQECDATGLRRFFEVDTNGRAVVDLEVTAYVWVADAVAVDDALVRTEVEYSTLQLRTFERAAYDEVNGAVGQGRGAKVDDRVDGGVENIYIGQAWRLWQCIYQLCKGHQQRNR